MAPFVTVMSDEVKSVVDLEVVKVSAIELSFDVSPLVTVEEDIVTVGAAVS